MHMEKDTTETKPRARILSGTVTSDRADKTVTVAVIRYVKHPKYQKYVKRIKRYHAHDPENAHTIGDVVKIRECAPQSKTKRFEVVN